MDTQTNLSFAWPWAIFLLGCPWLCSWLLKGWLGTRLSRRIPAQQTSLNLSHWPTKQLPPTAVQLTNLKAQRPWLLILCWSALVLALMRPQLIGPELPLTQQARNLLLAVDISGSMQEAMQGTTRLEQAKKAVATFIQQRPYDQIGLVVFGGQAYLYVPQTLDHQLLIQQLNGLQPGMAGQGTALGDALGLSLQYILKFTGQPTIILLTDGANNAGQLLPSQALATAQKAQVPVYLVNLDLEIDTELAVAVQATGGQIFNAFSATELAAIYQKIQQLEPASKVSYLRPAQSLAYIPLLIALLILARQLNLNYLKRKHD